MLVVSNTWIARAVTGAVLLGGAVWVIRLERERSLCALRKRRRAESGGLRGTPSPARGFERGPRDAIAALPPIRIDPLHPEVRRLIGAHGEIEISIRLSRPSAPERGRSKPPRPRTRPAR